VTYALQRGEKCSLRGARLTLSVPDSLAIARNTLFARQVDGSDQIAEREPG